jgi:hypothetical protein
MTADNAELALSDLLNSKTDEFLEEGDRILKGEPVTPATPTTPTEPVKAAEPETPSAPPVAEPEAEPVKDPASAAPAPERKAFNDFTAKFGGDPEKGAQHYFEVMRQNAEFKRKLDEAKAAPAAPPAAQVSPAVEPEVPPLVKELDQSILALSTEFNQVEEHLKQVKAVKPQWIEHRDNLIDQLTEATDADVAAKIRADLTVAKRSIAKIEAVEQAASGRRDQLIRDYRTADLNRRVAQQLHEERQARTSLVTTSEERQVQEERKAFFSAVDRVAASKGIPEADREDFREEAQLRANHKVNALDEEIPDYEAFVGEIADRFIGRQRRVAASYAEQKKVDSKPAAPQGKAAVVPAPAKRPNAQTLEELSSRLDDQWAQERV